MDKIEDETRRALFALLASIIRKSDYNRENDFISRTLIKLRMSDESQLKADHDANVATLLLGGWSPDEIKALMGDDT